MDITNRKYKEIDDYKKICAFLEKTYLSSGTRFDDNITLFEFQCALSCGIDEIVKGLDAVLCDVFLWYDGEELVGILENGTFCIDADYRFIYEDIVKTQENLHPATDKDIEWNIYEGDKDFENILINRGYYKTEDYWVRREIELSAINNVLALPDGFSVELITNLNDHYRVYMAYKFCYGILFNKNIYESFYKTSTYRKELDLVVLNPEGNVVAVCSGRYDEKNKIVSIEAVSCYHEYRNMGISKALLLYELNAAKILGAKMATVFTSMSEKYPAPNKLYESVGFTLVGNIYVWKKE